MKAGEERQGAVMQPTGVEFHRGARWAAPKEIDGPAFASELNGRFPRLGLANGFDDNIKGLWSGVSDDLDHVALTRDDNGLFRAEFAGAIQALLAASGQRYVTSRMPCEGDEHEADGAATYNEDALTFVEMAIADSLDNAGERFGEGSVPKGSLVLQTQEIALDETLGDGDRFGIRAIEEEEIITKIFLLIAAVKALAARSGVGDNDPIADAPGTDVRGDFGNETGHFVSENGGRCDHAGVIAALENFEVGAASERGFYAQSHSARGKRARLDLLDPQIFASVQHRGFHRSCQHIGTRFRVEQTRQCG